MLSSWIMHFSLPPQIYYYADSIYATAGVKQNDIQYVTVGTGAVNVFMTIAAVSILLMSKVCCVIASAGDNSSEHIICFTRSSS